MPISSSSRPAWVASSSCLISSDVSRTCSHHAKAAAQPAEPASFPQRLTLNRAAAEKAAFVLRKVGPRMGRAAVVPHDEIAEPPDMFEDEFAPLADFVELIEDR